MSIAAGNIVIVLICIWRSGQQKQEMCTIIPDEILMLFVFRDRWLISCFWLYDDTHRYCAFEQGIQSVTF